MKNMRDLQHFITYMILRKTIRDGLLLSLPLVIAGAIALTICSIPIPAYQHALQAFGGGKVYAAINAIFVYTFSILPLIFLLTMGFSFGKAVSKDLNEIFYYPLVTFCSYLIFIDSPTTLLAEAFGTAQTFTAITVTISACVSLRLLRNWRYTDLQFYLRRPSSVFISIYKMLLPSLLVLLLFSIVSVLFTQDFKAAFIHLHQALFQYLGIDFWGFSLYVLIEHLYWFFGIHGSNVLAGVTSAFLDPNMAENTLAWASGSAPPHIYTQAFLYGFVWLGGCGSVLCLVLSIFCFSKSIHTRRIARLSLLPCLFNISEIIIIGLPIICNPVFLIPFLAVPLSCAVIGSLAMTVGWVPVTVHPVAWTTPVLLSGYLSTDSIAGAVLQLITLIVGIWIYKPFVARYEQAEAKSLKTRFDAIICEIQRCEKLGQPPSFHTDTELEETARMLTFDLRHAIKNRQLHLYYQPQISDDGTIYGGEALLRWRHPQLGFVYPPLIIFLAREEGFLDELGLSLIETTCQDLQQLEQTLPLPLEISVNIAPQQLHNPDFCDAVEALLQKYRFQTAILAFEITEQVALSGTNEIMERLHRLKDMGIRLSMDDFGMGHSSVLYLQDTEFDVVKLDGSLVKKFLNSERSADIIRAITQLSKKFNFKVVAEFVETAQQREKLLSLGCHIYQGWLYSPAIPLPDFIAYVKQRQTTKVVNQ